MSSVAQVLSLDESADRPKTPRRPTTASSRSKQAKLTDFRRLLENDELPLTIESSKYGMKHRARWTVNMESFDYSHYLPLCIGGIQDALASYRSFAFETSMQLLENGLYDTRALQCLPVVMVQIKNALNTREKEIVHLILRILQQLAVCEGVGEALTEYYRTVLPLCNILQDQHLGTGDEHTKGLVTETLETMEAYGMDDAHAMIQQYVPTFSSLSPSDRLLTV